MAAPTILAIDFGTSNSLLAAANADEILAPAPLDPFAPDPSVLRSALYFTEWTEPAYFGVRAVKEFLGHESRGRLIRSIKRHLPAKSFTRTRVGNKMVTLEELIGRFLESMRRTACEHYGVDVKRLVVGRPARFSADEEADQLAETRLKAAAGRAGFEEVIPCPEPVAVAYDLEEDLTASRLVLICDLGGGTSDFTIVRIGSKGFAPEDILSIGGVSVAGDAIDGAVVRTVVAPDFGATAKYMAPFGTNKLDFPVPWVELLSSPADLTMVDRDRVAKSLHDIRRGLVTPEKDRVALDRFITLVEDSLGFSLYESTERAKWTLSTAASTEIVFDYPDIQLRAPLDRSRFEDVSAAPLAKIMACLADVLAKASLRPDDIEVVCLTGGTSRIPLVEATFRATFPDATFRRLSSFHSVVRGLARHARAFA